MSSTLQLDPNRILRLTGRLVRDAEIITKISHEMASIPPGTGVETAIGRAIDIASETASAATLTSLLTRRILSDAIGADRLGAMGAGSWWAFLLLAGFGPNGIPGTGSEPTADDDPATTRQRFTQMMNERGPDSWNDLPPDVRAHIIATCPELVMQFVKARGGRLTADDREALDEAFAYDEISNSYSLTGKARFKVVKFDLVGGGELELAVVERSDGTVTITYSDGGDGGVGVSTKSGDSKGSADVTVGANREITWEFESREQADAALAELERAAAGVVGAVVRRPEGWGQLFAFSPVATVAQATVRGIKALTADTVQETLNKWGDHIDRVDVAYEMTRAIEGSVSIPAFANLSAAAGNTMEVKYSDEAGGDDDYFAASVSVAVSGSAAASLATVAGGTGFKLSGDAEATAAVEFRKGLNGQDRIVVTLDGQVTGGLDRVAAATRSEPRQISGGTLERNQASGRAASLTIEIPVDDTTKGAANDVVQALADGDDPSDALETLYNETDVTITTSDVETESYKASVTGLGHVTAAHDIETTTDVYRKRPHGDWYCESDLANQLDDD